jgi:uncharacterized membrane protein YfcA
MLEASRKRHPLADRPLIDWDLVIIMEPLTIAGGLGGSFLSRLLPSSLVLSTLVVALTFLSIRTIRKGTRQPTSQNEQPPQPPPPPPSQAWTRCERRAGGCRGSLGRCPRPSRRWCRC